MIATVGLGAAALAGLKLLLRGEDPATEKLWETAAQRIGGDLIVVKGSFFRDTVRQISTEVAGVPLTVDTFVESDGKTRVYYTRVAAGRLPAAGSTHIACRPRGIVHKLSKRLGLERSLTGDEAFDETCHVDAEPAAVALAFLDGPTRRLLTTLEEAFTIESGCLTVVRRGLPSEAATLVDMARFVQRLTERWCAVVESVAHLADALGLVCDASFAIPDEGDAVVARGLRRAHTATLLLRVSKQGVETVVKLDDMEIAFEGLTPGVEEVVMSVDAAADRHASTSSYR